VGQIKDPISPLEEILKKVNKNELLLLYKIPDYNDVNEFLMHVSISRGKMVRVYIHIFLHIVYIYS